jgi:hypothetical protein
MSSSKSSEMGTAASSSQGSSSFETPDQELQLHQGQHKQQQ